MQNTIHDTGLGIGWVLIAAGNLLQVVMEHGMTLLSMTSIVFGMFCQGYAVWLRWNDRRERRNQKQKDA
jgi:hypothetical protein